MKCLCLGGCAGTTTYKLFDPATVRYSGTLTLCPVCKKLLERTPNTREKQFAANTLRWQSGTVPEVEPDISFSTAIAADLPAAFMTLARNENGGPTLVSASVLLDGGESGTGAGLICQSLRLR